MTLLLIWLVCGIAAGMIANGKGRSGALWFLVGLLFGPLGVLAAFLVGTAEARSEKALIQDYALRPCPSCRRGVAWEATGCPHCGAVLQAQDRPKRVF